jgi:hypothetical protein
MIQNNLFGLFALKRNLINQQLLGRMQLTKHFVLGGLIVKESQLILKNLFNFLVGESHMEHGQT